MQASSPEPADDVDLSATKQLSKPDATTELTGRLPQQLAAMLAEMVLHQASRRV